MNIIGAYIKSIFFSLSFLICFVSTSYTQVCGDCNEPINFKFPPNLEPQIGETILVDFLVCGFQDIISFQFPVLYNPVNMKFTGGCFVANLVPFDCNSVQEIPSEPGGIRVLWINEDLTPRSLEAEAVLFTLEFEITGISPEPDSIKIVDNIGGFGFEFVRGDPNDLTVTQEYQFCQDGGEFFTECSETLTFINSCSGTAAGSGKMEFFACGGTAPYEYEVTNEAGNVHTYNNGADQAIGSISDNLTAVEINDLNPGEKYYISITDADGNLQPLDSVVLETVEALSVEIDQAIPILCAEGPQRTTRLEAIGQGGTPPYQYRWDEDLGSFPRVSDILEGTYSVTVIDANGCDANTTINVMGPEPISLEIDTIFGPGCEGAGGLGTVELTVTGGQPLYNSVDGQYEIVFTNTETGNRQFSPTTSQGNLSFQAQNLSRPEAGLLAGTTWTVQADDHALGFNNQCLSNEATISIPVANAFDFEFQDTTVDCLTGLASVSVFVEPTFQPSISPNVKVFDPSGQRVIVDSVLNISGGQIEGLSVGRYFLEFTNLNDGCTGTDSFTVAPAAELSINEMSLEVVQPGCNTGPTGRISFEVENGTPPFSFDWSDGMTTDVPTRSDLGPAMYNVTVSDQGNCIAQLTQDIEIAGGGAVTISEDQIEVINPDCGESLGALQIILTSDQNMDDLVFDLGEGPIDVVDGMINDLAPGLYTLNVSLVTDSTCFIPIEKLIEETPPLEIGTPVVENPGCLSSELGRIILSPAGAGPFTYEWDNGETESIRRDLKDSMYFVTITDSNECFIVDSFALTLQIDIPFPGGIPISPSCAEVSNGMFILDDPADELIATLDGVPQASDTIFGLKADSTYMISAFFDNDNRCAYIPEPITLVVLDERIEVEFEAELPACTGLPGSILAMPVNAVGDVTFQWDDDNNSTEARLTDITSGDYNVTVVDEVGCSTAAEFTLIDGEELSFDLTSVTDPTCQGENNGTASIDVSGGSVGVYDFEWSSGEVEQQASSSAAVQLSEGEQFVFVTDGACADTVKFDVGEGERIRLLTDTVNDVMCSGEESGQIILQVGGGTDEYNFEWSHDPELNEPSAVMIPNGTYELTITDVNLGCEYLDTFVIEAPNELFVSIDSSQTKNISCNNPAGIIVVNASGGNGDLTFDWTNNVSETNFANNLEVGEYGVTVTDANGCMLEEAYAITAPEAIFFDLNDFLNPSCFGESSDISVTNVSGGVGGFRFSVNAGPLVPIDDSLALESGNYSINVFDSDGCSSEAIEFSIEDPDPPLINLGQDTTVELGEALRLIAQITAAEGIDTIIWSGDFVFTPLSSDLSVINIEPDQSFDARATLLDNNQCTAFDEISIKVRPTRNIYIPNIIYTNGPTDGSVNFRNTTFKVFTGRGVEAVNSIMIFDRWGSIVYESGREEANESGVGLGNWNGEFNNKDVEPGVYAYIVDVSFSDGQQLTYKGNVTVIN